LAYLCVNDFKKNGLTPTNFTRIFVFKLLPKETIMEEITRNEEYNRRKGLIFSVIFHTALIILAAIYGFSYQTPPPEPGGIMVNLGIPDVGQGEENAPQGDPAPPVEEPQPEPKEETPPPAKEEPKKEVEKTKPDPTPKKEVRKTEDPEAIALKKKKEEERKRQEAEARQRAEEERKRKEAEAEAKRKADEERKRKEAEAQALKDKIAGGLGGGKGSGKGNTGKPGNQGDPSGDPNASALEGKSSGSGVVGGGLGSRGVLKKGPAIRDDSQEEGTVVLNVCVDKNGDVISAEYTLSGSSTNNSRLKQLAIANAKQWQFSKGDVDKQCGTIRYDFKLK
jgi:TonB family protein